MVRLSLFIVFAALCMPAAAADCVEQQQDVRLDQHTVSTVKSYRCAVGGDQLAIAFYELSGVAAGIVLGQSPALSTMANILGAHQLVHNEVSDAYANLFSAFSKSFAIGGEEGPTLFASVADREDKADRTFGQAEGLQGDKVRAILLEPGAALYYPVTQELSFLQQGVLPPGMKFFYWVVCGVGESGQPDCASFRDTRMVMWRGMTPADLRGYDEKVAIENQTITSQGVRTGISTLHGAAEGVGGYLQFVEAVAGGALPEDFLTLELSWFPEGCAGDAFWNFEFAPRDMALRVAVVTNLSERAVVLDSLLGAASNASGLRVASPGFDPASETAPIDIGAHTIPPGGSVVVPFQIRFPAPKAGVETSGEVELSNAYFQEVGAQGLAASGADYGFPHPRDYAYGPEISLSGIRVNGSEVTLAPRSANFVELVASYEEGSCPYLMAWDAADGEWIDHGKVLHAAKGAARQETEIVPFSGFLSRVKLEEREPEIASIDAVTLEVKLRDGRIVLLPALQEALAVRDRSYFRLVWNEAVEIGFDLPEGVAEADVVESRLLVTGFYQPYAGIRAASAAPATKMGAAPSAQAAPLCPMRGGMGGRR